MENSILTTQYLTKRFGSVNAVSEIDFSINRGEIRAVIGPNGAGKSTFVKILYGEILPDQGAIYLNGQLVRFGTPGDALSAGISMVPQDFGLIESMSVAENINLTAYPQNSIIYKKSLANKRASQILRQLSSYIDPEKAVRELTVAEKQVVAIAKALNSKSNIIIFDEPTSVLDTRSFLIIKNLLKELRDSGKAIIYVTHKLDEIYEIADSVSVFLDSKIVFTSSVSNLNRSDLLKYFGIELSNKETIRKPDEQTVLLNVSNLTTRNLDDISFTVNMGECVGVVSENQTEGVELVKSIFGAAEKIRGEVKLGKHRLTTPLTCVENKVGFIPEDRRHDGIFNLFSVYENISILNFKKKSRLGFFMKGTLIQNAIDKVGQLRIKCKSVSQSISELSGGNQQKVLLAKWMSSDIALLLLLEPTAGIDLGGRSDIYSIISGLKNNGKSFLITSSDKAELEDLCDKILLIENGKVSRLVPTADYFNGN